MRPILSKFCIYNLIFGVIKHLIFSFLFKLCTNAYNSRCPLQQNTLAANYTFTRRPLNTTAAIEETIEHIYSAERKPVAI